MADYAPAFDFYPERWLAGVAHLSDVDQLRYFRLLCHAWLMDGLPDDMKIIARLAGGKPSAALLQKWPVNGDGKRRNPFQEKIRIAQKQRIARKREGARQTNAKRWHRESLSESDSGSLSVSPPPSTVHRPPESVTAHASNVVLARIRPTLAQARAAAGQVGVTEVEADEWWHAREATDWMRPTASGGTIKVGANWQADLKTYTNTKKQRNHDDHQRTRSTNRRTDGLNKPGRYGGK